MSSRVGKRPLAIAAKSASHSAWRHDDVGLAAKDPNAIPTGDGQLRHPGKQIAAGLRKTGSDPFDGCDPRVAIVSDRLLTADALIHPTLGLCEPALEHGLGVSGCP